MQDVLGIYQPKHCANSSKSIYFFFVLCRIVSRFVLGHNLFNIHDFLVFLTNMFDCIVLIKKILVTQSRDERPSWWTNEREQSAHDKFYSSCFLPQTDALWDQLPRVWFTSHYNFNMFSSRVSVIFPPPYPHKLYLVLCNSLPRVAFWPCTVWTSL